MMLDVLVWFKLVCCFRRGGNLEQWRGGNLEQWPNTTSSSEVSKKVAEDEEGENGGWKIELIIFVGGTSGSVHAQTLNDNLKELQVNKSKRNVIRKCLVYNLTKGAQDMVLCSYFAQRLEERSKCQGGATDEVFQGMDNFG
jgi:hypothetical protein